MPLFQPVVPDSCLWWGGKKCVCKVKNARGPLTGVFAAVRGRNFHVLHLVLNRNAESAGSGII